MEDADGTPGSWAWLGPALAVAGNWTVNQWRKDCVCACARVYRYSMDLCLTMPSKNKFLKERNQYVLNHWSKKLVLEGNAFQVYLGPKCPF